MNALTAVPQPHVDREQLALFTAMEPADAIAELKKQGLATPETIGVLAETALQQAETAPADSERWLQLATALDTILGGDALCQAQIGYAQARIYVQQGELALAEAQIRQAQSLWQTAGDQSGFTRSLLGLAQILAMQGRYAEAEVAARQAIANLEQPLGDAYTPSYDLTMQIIRAHQNLATVLIYQDKHEVALDQYDRARQQLQSLMTEKGLPVDLLEEARLELAYLELNRASALMFLDAPELAETALLQAITLFDQAEDTLWRGKARTNLGALFMRTGRYAAALDEFSRASTDVLGEQVAWIEPDLAVLRRADVLFLEQAMAYLALNLLPEAMIALERCERLFRDAEQPYELGQALYIAGLLQLRNGDYQRAEQRLLEAAALFGDLKNRFWLNRTEVALATLAYQRGDLAAAGQRLDGLVGMNRPILDGEEAVAWDIHGLVEANLLRLHIYVDTGELGAANVRARFIAHTIGESHTHTDLPDLTATNQLENSGSEKVSSSSFFIYLQQRFAYAQSRITRAAGQAEQTKQHLYTAIRLLEQQRASLPVEEIRTAFLDDKTAVYDDLIEVILNQAQLTIDQLCEAFAIMEQARSRALLERLWTAVDEGTYLGNLSTDNPGEHSSTDATLLVSAHQRLHWFYNQLLGETGDRHLDAETRRQLQAQEALVQQMAWQTSPLQVQAEPVDLPAFQETLAVDQQAIIYAIVHQEVCAFLIDQHHVQVFRRLCTRTTLHEAQAELRFQMGRVEIGADYLRRHAPHVQARLHKVLHQLYQQLVAPLRAHLIAPRLLLIPAGSLHLLPFHALWDGVSHLVTQFECSYAPSASVARLRWQRQSPNAYRKWAGLALTDPAIPAAQQEIVQSAAYFSEASLYFDEQAGRAGLQQAARQADILHIATHGLFRPDNPFFSALKLADGWIDVREIYRLPLAARLVVLSACESGATEVRGGDEVVGLARGFLGAGAQELLVSLWNVHDATAANFMAQFYAALTSGTSPQRPAAALRVAQCRAIANQLHPYFWAPYFVIGE